MDYKPQYSDIVCGPLANPELHHALHSMPRLSTVVVHCVYPHEFRHGITWETLCSLLSLPSLSRLALGRIWICPITPDAAALKLNPSSPLSCFEYADNSIEWRMQCMMVEVSSSICERGCMCLVCARMNWSAMVRSTWVVLLLKTKRERIL